MSHIELRLTRIELPSKALYETKLAEIELYQRYCSHQHMVTALTHWDIPVDDVYAVDKGVYRKIAVLTKPYSFTLQESVVRSGDSLTPALALRHFGEVAKALNVLHSVNVVHGGVAVDNIIMLDNDSVALGLPRKTETDVLRQALSGNPNLEELASNLTAAWAPEIMSNYGDYYAAVDVWALAVSMFTVVTGDPPFDDIVHATKPQNISWTKLDTHARLRYVMENMIVVHVAKRWDILTVHQYCQNFFATEMQRIYRGHAEVRHWGHVRNAILMIQRVCRGRLGRLRARRLRDGVDGDTGGSGTLDDPEASTASASRTKHWREIGRENIDEETRGILMLQANVLCRQYSRAFSQYRAQVVKCQGIVRRVLAKRWFQSVLAHRSKLEDQLEDMHQSAVKHQKLLGQLAGHFDDGRLPFELHYLESLEEYQLSHTEFDDEYVMPAQTAWQKTKRENDLYKKEIEGLTTELNALKEELRTSHEKDKRLQSELGPKYNELAPMVNAIERNLQRVCDLHRNSAPIPMSLLHTSRSWTDPSNPYNILDNVLHDTEQLYKAPSIQLDAALKQRRSFFVAELILYTWGEAGGVPEIELQIANHTDDWKLVTRYVAKKSRALQRFTIPGEQHCRLVRVLISIPDSHEMVVVRNIAIKGLELDDD